jgi:hypothetical protein
VLPSSLPANEFCDMPLMNVEATKVTKFFCWVELEAIADADRC